MILESTKLAAFTPGVIIPAIITTMQIDLIWVISILIGLFFGWTARIGKLVHQRSPWQAIRRDIIVSLLVGGGIGLISTIFIFITGASYLQGVGISFIFAFGGVSTLESIYKWILARIKKEINPDSNSTKEVHYHLSLSRGRRMNTTCYKRGFKKTYDEQGNLISKIRMTRQEYEKSLLPEDDELTLFGEDVYGEVDREDS